MANQAVVGVLRTLITADTAQFDTSMRKASQATVKFGNDVQVMSKQAERLAKGFGGDKLLASANSLVQAVQKVGGAAKLTEAEQRRVNAQITEAITKYRALGQVAPKAMLDLQKATMQATTAMQAMGKHMQALGAGVNTAFKGNATAAMQAFGKQMQAMGAGVNSAFKEMGTASGATSVLTTRTVALGAAIGSALGNVAVMAISKVARLLLDAAANAQQFSAISGSFDRLTASIQESGEAMLVVTRGATKGLVSDLELMQAANKAILLGLPVTSKEMATLAKTAVTLGRAMGQDAASSLNDLITALGRTSPLILDNLGLTVRVEEANEKYAASIGKTASELTEAERKLAFYQAAMTAAEKKTDELGAVNLTVMDQFKRLGVSVTNVVTEMIAGANESGQFSQALGHLADSAAQAAQDLRDMTQARRELSAEMQSAPMGEGAGMIVGIPDPEMLERQLAKIREARSRILAETKAALAQPEGIGALGPTREEIRRLDEQTAALTARLKEHQEWVRRTQEAYADLLSEFRNAEGLAKFNRDAADLALLLSEVTDALKIAGVTLDEFNMSTVHGIEAGLEYNRILKEREENLRRLGMMVDLSAHTDNKASQQVFGDVEAVESEWMGTIRRIGENLTMSISDALAGALTRMHSFKDAFLSIWQSIKQAFTDILASMLDSFVRGFIDPLMKKLGEFLGKLAFGGGGGAGGGGGILNMAGGALPGILGGGGGAGAGTGAGVGAPSLGFLSNPAFWTNPYTIAAIAGIALVSWGVTKKGWFRGGEEGVQVNPRRDKFQMQFARPGESVAEAGQRIAAQLTTWTGQPGGGPLFAALQRADSVKEFERAQSGIVAEFKKHGTGLKSFAMGGFVPPGVNQLAMLHGGAMGELVMPVAKMQDSGRQQHVVHNHYWTVQGWDGADIARVLEREWWPRFNREMSLNQYGGGSSARRASTVNR